MNCRLCGGATENRLDLGETPVANALDSTALYPLGLDQCLNCGHVQISYEVPDSELYGEHYVYRTPMARAEYQDNYVAWLQEHFPDPDTILEIGCNNGIFMDAMEEADYGHTVVGLDPSTYWGNFQGFDSHYRSNWPFDLIIANNTFAHIHDLDDVFKGVSLNLAAGGALVFENQYFPEQVKKGAFDNIYHEHKDYHQIEPLKRFARKHGLVLTDVLFTEAHGGSARFVMQREGEETTETDPPIRWDLFQLAIDTNRELLHESLDQFNGAKPALWGASAKATTRLHVLGIADRFAYCVDDTPGKQGHTIPGTDIEICPAEAFEDDPPAAVYLTAWNYRDIFEQKYPGLTVI